MITKESLEQQIEAWINEKHTMVANINMLEGAIQGHRSLLAQLEQEQENGDIEATAHQTVQEAGHDNGKSGRDIKAPEIVKAPTAKSKSKS